MAVKNKHRIPQRLRACHTGLIGGYVIEGHVPGNLIARLLKEKPGVTGLAVPGMPIGSPGMEGPNPEPYDVFSFDKRISDSFQKNGPSSCPCLKLPF